MDIEGCDLKAIHTESCISPRLEEQQKGLHMMTKKDFIKFAQAIKYTYNVPMCLQERGFENSPENAQAYREQLAFTIGEVLEKDNYRFDWSLWNQYIFNQDTFPGEHNR